MIAVPAIGLNLEIPEEMNEAGFNPYLATIILDRVAERRKSEWPKSPWHMVPVLIQRPVSDHVEIVPSPNNAESINAFKEAELGGWTMPPTPIVRQVISIVRGEISQHYRNYKEKNAD